MKKPDGLPAFPRSSSCFYSSASGREVIVSPQAGMSLRAYLAGQAMVGFLANMNEKAVLLLAQEKGTKPSDVVVQSALDLADALIAELEK